MHCPSSFALPWLVLASLGVGGGSSAATVSAAVSVAVSVAAPTRTSNAARVADLVNNARAQQNLAQLALTRGTTEVYLQSSPHRGQILDPRGHFVDSVGGSAPKTGTVPAAAPVDPSSADVDSGLLVDFEGTKRFLVFCGAGLIVWTGLLNLLVGSRLRRRPARAGGRGGTGPGGPGAPPDLAELLTPYHLDRS